MIGVKNAPEPTALLPADEPGAASINYKITQDNRKEARDYADRCDMGFGAPQQAVNDVSTLATRLHHEFGHEAEPILHHAWLMVRDVMGKANWPNSQNYDDETAIGLFRRFRKLI